MAALTLMLAAAAGTTAYAVGWEHDGRGWRWEKTSGQNLYRTWEWLDGNQDGIAECYYFDDYGYMLSDTTTPDGYTVNASGAWYTEEGVQRKEVEIVSIEPAPPVEFPDVIYDENGINTEAVDMMRNGREANAKYGELEVNDNKAHTAVVYANGFRVYYPKLATEYKMLQPIDEKDDACLFRHYRANMPPKDAYDYLIGLGYTEGIGTGQIGMLGRAAVTLTIDWNCMLRWQGGVLPGCYLEEAYPLLGLGR